MADTAAVAAPATPPPPSPLLAEFRKRYPQYNDMPDRQVFMNMADPDKLRQAFPEYKDLSDTEIGRNVAAEAGKVDTGKSGFKTWASDLGDIIHHIVVDKKLGFGSGDLTPPDDVIRKGSDAIAAWNEEHDKQRQQLLADASARREKAGYSLPYRYAADTLQRLGLYDPSAMEDAASKGHMGEVLGHAAADATVAAAPVVGEAAVKGTAWAGAQAREALMDTPEVARLKALNVPKKSPKMVRANKEATAAAPYLQGATDLEDLKGRVTSAKQEIWQPYADAVQRAGPRAEELEAQRLKVSAEQQTWREMKPSDAQTALQKGAKIKELNDQYRKITTELDPMVRNEGVNPTRTRATFGAVKGVERRIEGRETTLEGRPSGAAKIAIGTAKAGAGAAVGAAVPVVGPVVGAELGAVAGAKDIGVGARDLIAGRGWWEQKPTDVAVKEGFRVAGPKPDLSAPYNPATGPQQGPQVRGMLPPAPVIAGPSSVANSTQGGPPAINIAPTSRAQRKGLLLPEKASLGTVPEGPSGSTPPTEGEAAAAKAAQAAAGQPSYRIVRDSKSGKYMKQFLTTGGGEHVYEPMTTKEVMASKPAEVTNAPSVSIPAEVTPAKLKKVTGAQKSDEGYVYHATNEERAVDIAKDGLRTHRANEYTDQSTWPDGSTERRNYFTKTAEHTWQFAPEDGKPVLLRTKPGAGFKPESGTGDIYTKGKVPASAIEYLGEDDKWHPVTDLKAKGKR